VTKNAPKRRTASAVSVRVIQLGHAEGLPLPAYQTEGAAGLDLVAAVPAKRPVRLAKGKSALIPTGLVLELPRGTEAQVRPRSGLAMKHGVTVLNSPGTIDCDYRGEVQVLLVNLGAKPFTVKRGERIAQLVVAPVTRARLVAAKAVTATARGAGGFGSTGTVASTGLTQRKVAGAQKSKPMPRRSAATKRPAVQASRSKARSR
jgi:dUTP pyrophosphatase